MNWRRLCVPSRKSTPVHTLMPWTCTEQSAITPLVRCSHFGTRRRSQTSSTASTVSTNWNARHFLQWTELTSILILMSMTTCLLCHSSISVRLLTQSTPSSRPIPQTIITNGTCLLTMKSPDGIWWMKMRFLSTRFQPCSGTVTSHVGKDWNLSVRISNTPFPETAMLWHIIQLLSWRLPVPSLEWSERERARECIESAKTAMLATCLGSRLSRPLSITLTLSSSFSSCSLRCQTSASRIWRALAISATIQERHSSWMLILR